ncbi:MAG: carboxynorspermidine decarboxylase [Pseudomonadota bacterium]
MTGDSRAAFDRFDPYRVPSPCYVVDEARIAANLAILRDVADRSGARILLALKAFSMFALAPLVRSHLHGTCASGLFEARLGREEFGGAVHTYGAAYREADIERILALSDHIVFNSQAQLARFRPQIEAEKARRPHIKVGLRINPERPVGDNPLYDPSAPFSRLGIVGSQLDRDRLHGVSGLHVHNLCEQDFLPLQETVAALEEQFADVLPSMQWLNLGGGHHITRSDYQRDALVECIRTLSDRYGLQIYLEPGEAIAWEAGILVCEVLDTLWNGMPIAVVDTSATAHMPDVIEAPYVPEILGADQPGAQAHTCRIGGQTCLAGDVFGDYSFAEALAPGQRLKIWDAAYYTMVKTTTFNGIALPAMALWNSQTDALRVVRSFGYEAFRDRLS